MLETKYRCTGNSAVTWLPKMVTFSTKREPYLQGIQDSMFYFYQIHFQCSYLNNALAPLAPRLGSRSLLCFYEEDKLVNKSF